MTTNGNHDAKIHPKPRRRRKGAVSDQRLSAYINFGYKGTLCLGIFLAIYILILLCLSPLLYQEAPAEVPQHRGDVLRPVVSHAMENVKQHIPHVPGQIFAGEMAGIVKKQLASYRRDQGVTDSKLMETAVSKFNKLRGQRHSANAEKESAAQGIINLPATSGKPSGFAVLGMHRSGTSMLSGLLVLGFGYKVGAPLIGGAFDNPKGFFELVPAVLQNDKFMGEQGVYWASNVVKYDYQRALDKMKEGKIDFKQQGEKALRFYNNPDNSPWLQKDPRMCITLKTWLSLLNSKPAVVFTYRHPLEVALSLKKREKNFSLDHGLRLWIIYNMRALQNSADLCRVLSSNEAVLKDPLGEVTRISEELTTKCGVPSPERKLDQETVDKFIDPDLQHNKKQREMEDASKPILLEYDGCKIHDYESSEPAESTAYKRERDLYTKAMKIYCDLQSGKAYAADYEWPSLQ